MSSDTLSTVLIVLGPVAVGAIFALVGYWVRGRRHSVRETRRPRDPD